jgi:hypothetical protein
MWKRLKRELLFEFYWYSRHYKLLRQLDSPLGLFGAVLIISGIFLAVIACQAFAAVFRNMIPLVRGADVAGIYWNSVFMAIKFSIVLIIFISSLTIVLYLRCSRRE